MKLAVVCVLLVGAPGLAQEPEPSPSPTPTTEQQPLRREEVVVVTASRAETALLDAPATMSVITDQTIVSSPARGYPELLRSVPGLNVVQMSVRDFNVSTRQGAETLGNSELALVDGRPLNLDFIGTVLWDAVPVEATDVKQIEVIRGPASAVWGANALTGVVNVVTKTPGESPGTNVLLSGGIFSRDAGLGAGQDPGGLVDVGISHARVVNDRWSLRVSGGYYGSDALPRPAGRVPVGTNPLNPSIVIGGGDYPGFPNRGTRQPRADARLDQELSNGGRLTYEAGFNGVGGIIETGIGPFELSGIDYGFGRVAYSKGGFRLNGFANLLRGTAPSLLVRDASGERLKIGLKTTTFDVDTGDSRRLGGRQTMTYGGNVRRNVFSRISVAPGVDDRTELGAFLQDEVSLGPVHLVLGTRVDKSSVIDHAVVSPRLAALFKVTPSQAVRASVGRGFRWPTAIQNSLDVSTIAFFFPLGLVDPSFGSQEFPIVTRLLGDPRLREESLTSYEVGYTGSLGGRTTLEAAAYLTDSDNSIAFAGDRPYTATHPPPGWPLPPGVLTVLAEQGIFLPAEVGYINLGPVRNRGIELGADQRLGAGLRVFANYSLQAVPGPRKGATPDQILSAPPKHHINGGLEVSRGRALGVLSIHFTGRAFWADVLGPAYNGFTGSYTLVNASLAFKWAGGHLTTALKGTNLLNQDIQEHVFGDIVKRTVVAEVRISLPRTR